MPAEHCFYGELAGWWPLISPPQEYADEAAEFASVLGSASIPVREVLELGSGGGHNAVHLKTRFAMTLVDLSADMLTVSRRLNPECDHRQGDMRTVRLGRTFDAVFVHDAVEYMTSEAELREAVETAFVHCRPGASPCSSPMPPPRASSRRPIAAAPTRPTGAGRAIWNGRGIRIRRMPGS